MLPAGTSKSQRRLQLIDSKIQRAMCELTALKEYEQLITVTAAMARKPDASASSAAAANSTKASSACASLNSSTASSTSSGSGLAALTALVNGETVFGTRVKSALTLCLQQMGKGKGCSVGTLQK
jgi:hypothetical protein